MAKMTLTILSKYNIELTHSNFFLEMASEKLY